MTPKVWDVHVRSDVWITLTAADEEQAASDALLLVANDAEVYEMFLGSIVVETVEEHTSNE